MHPERLLPARVVRRGVQGQARRDGASAPVLRLGRRLRHLPFVQGRILDAPFRRRAPERPRPRRPRRRRRPVQESEEKEEEQQQQGEAALLQRGLRFRIHLRATNELAGGDPRLLTEHTPSYYSTRYTFSELRFAKSYGTWGEKQYTNY